MSSHQASELLQNGRTENQQMEIDVKYNFAKNHVGMTLTALEKIGSVATTTSSGENTAAALEDWTSVVKHYTQVNIPTLNNKEVSFGKPQDLEAVVTTKNFEEQMGGIANTTAFARYLHAETKETLASCGGDHKKTISALLKKYFSQLYPNIHGGAFHALLRVTYGMDANDAFEVSSGLAYMAGGYAPFPSDAVFAPTASDDTTIVSIIDKSVKDVFALAPTLAIDVSKSPSIQARQNTFFQNATFTAIVPKFVDDDDIPAALSAMRRASLAAFEQYQDFSVLHAVTSCCAMSTIVEHVTPAALTTYWGAVLATLACTIMLASAPGAKMNEAKGKTFEVDPTTTGDWASLTRKMFAVLRERSETESLEDFISSNLEHVVKLAYTCRQDSERDAELESRYLSVVRREVSSFARYY